jgi:MFS family permease
MKQSHILTASKGVVATAIPSNTNEFKSLDQIGWYGDHHLILIGSVVAGAASSSVALIVGRAIAGWGGAGIVGGSYVITHQISRPKRRPALTGLIGAVFIFSSILGPIIGGAFTYSVSWRWW